MSENGKCKCPGAEMSELGSRNSRKASVTRAEGVKETVVGEAGRGSQDVARSLGVVVRRAATAALEWRNGVI